jgi:SAM-dependent methyltransferase
MRLLRLAVVALLVGVVVTTVHAQRPDFSGEWRLDWQASGLKAAPVPDYVEVWTQTAATLTVDNGHGPLAVITYNLDGTPTIRKSDASHSTSVPRWDGATLEISHSISDRGQEFTSTVRYSLEGDRLTSVATMRGMTVRRVLTRVQAGTRASSASQSAAAPLPPLERWNKEFASGTPSLRNDAPNAFLAEVVKGRRPGAALDLGVGQGRNAIFLASSGWQVTGVDISDVAVAQARRNAEARKVTLTTVIQDLDTYDFGENQWDLVTSFYMHSWHMNSKTNIPARILRALKPGGLLVMEAFSRPPNANGFVVSELRTLFEDFNILRNEEALTKADWGASESSLLVRFVAQKPRQ